MNITAYLKDLDAEDQQLQQEIWKLQIRRQQIADARVLMMQREEERAQIVGQPSPFGVFPGGGTLRFRDPTAYRQEPPTLAEQLPPPADHTPAAELERRAENKRARDRERYHERKVGQRAKGYVKKRDGTWGPRERGERKDSGQPKNSTANRSANADARQRIRNAMEHRVEPTSSGDLIRAFGIEGEKEKQRIYNAVTTLYTKGELKKVGVSATGFTYLMAGKANGQPVA